MNTVIYALSLTLWLSAHLDDIAARFVGWLFTPFVYGGRHRKAFRESSSWDIGGWDIHMQAESVRDHYRELEAEEKRAAILAATVEPTPPYPARAEHGRLRPAMALPPPIDYSDDKVTAPAVLGLTNEGPIPVARIGGELVEVTT